MCSVYSAVQCSIPFALDVELISCGWIVLRYDTNLCTKRSEISFVEITMIAFGVD